MALFSAFAVRPLATQAARRRWKPAPAPLADTATIPAWDPHRTPWPGREITSGGVTLHVRETPGAPDTAAVYVHGLAGSATNWTDLADLLAGRATGMAIDLPGFGFSPPPTTGDYSPSAHAAALESFLAERDGPVHLIGNSFGGAVAIMVASQRPDLVRTLSVISPAMPDRRPDPRRVSDPRLLLAQVPGLGRRARAALAAETNRDRVESIVRLCFGDPTAPPEHRLLEAVAEYDARGKLPWAAYALDRTGRAMVASWVRGESLWAVARRVPVPTLVIWGDRDRLVAPRHAARTTRALRGRLLVLPGIGHVAQIEAPVTVARAVAGMWDAVDAGTWEDLA